MNIQNSKPYLFELEIRIFNIEFLLALGGRVGLTPGGPMGLYSRPPKPAENADPPGSPWGVVPAWLLWRRGKGNIAN